MSFRDNLIHLRAENNMTQERLAMMLGVSRQSVTKWEAEKSYPEMDKLIKMCQIFDCTLDDLVQGDLTDRAATKPLQIVAKTDPADLFGYNEHMNQFATRISMGIACPIVGAALTTFFAGLGPDGMLAASGAPTLPENIAATLATLAIFIGIICCLIFIIPAGLAHSDFVKQHPYIEDFYTTDQRARAQQSFVYQLIAGILCVFIGVLLIILFADTYIEELVALPAMLLCIALGAFFIVRGSILLSKTNIDNYNMAAGEALTASQIKASDMPEEQKERLSYTRKTDQRRGAICGIIMIVATIVGLVMLFVPEYQNELFWLAWPIGGLCCGIACLLITAITGESSE